MLGRTSYDDAMSIHGDEIVFVRDKTNNDEGKDDSWLDRTSDYEGTPGQTNCWASALVGAVILTGRAEVAEALHLWWALVSSLWCGVMVGWALGYRHWYELGVETLQTA